MATIVATSVDRGFAAVTTTTLDGTDDFVYDANAAPLLILSNDTGSSATVVIDGNAGSTVQCDGVGSVDVSGGISQVIANGETFAVRLGTIRSYLQGSVSVSGGAGLEAQLIHR